METQIPSVDDLISPAITALVSSRPRAIQHITGPGMYGDVIAGWTAEVRLNRARLADEVLSGRLPFATGTALRQLARSEFWFEPGTDQTKALGTITLLRDSGGPGTIPAGKRFSLAADPTTIPPTTAASFVSVAPTVVADGATAVDVNLIAAEAGTQHNIPFPVNGRIDDKLFDTFTAGPIFAAGGSNGISDPALRIGAKANYVGQFGPVSGALVAGAIGTNGCEHVAVAEDTDNAISKVFAADASWASSPYFLSSLEQKLKNTRQGFGCQLSCKLVHNHPIKVSATVVLTDRALESDITALTVQVAQAVQSYFDDRVDFWTWKATTLGATITNASRSILACTDVSVIDAVFGNTIPEPAIAIDPTDNSIFHWYLVQSDVQLVIQNPA